MLLPKTLRRIISVFRGDLAPVMIILSVVTGFWIGLMPGWSGLHTVLLFLMLILNVNFGVVILSAGLGRALCYAACPLLFHAGRFVLEYMPWLFDFLGGIPVVGLTDFSFYCVAAACILGPAVGFVLGMVFCWIVTGFRRMWITLEDKSEKLKRWERKWWVKFLEFLLVGKKGVAEVRSVFAQKPKIVRKTGVVLSVILLAVFAGVSYFLKNDTVRNYTAYSLTQLNGAEVNIKELDVQAGSGSLSVAGMQWTDPEKRHQNRYVVDRVSGDISIYALSVGKILIERLELSGLSFDQEREAPGKVLQTGPAGGRKEKPADTTGGTTEKEAGKARKLDDYLKDAEEIVEWLKKLSEWFPERDGEEPAEEGKEPEAYLEYLTARAPVPPSERIRVKEIVLEGIEIPIPQFGTCDLRIENMSDAPYAAALPVRLHFISVDKENSLLLLLHYDAPEKGVDITGALPKIDLGSLQPEMSASSGILFKQGTVKATMEGTASRALIDLSLTADVDNLQAGTRGGKGVLGLDADIASEALGVLESLKTTMRITGALSDPDIVLDASGLRDTLKRNLVEAGKKRLVKEFEKQAGKVLSDRIDKGIKDNIPDAVKDPVKKPVKDIMDGVKGIFGNDD